MNLVPNRSRIYPIVSEKHYRGVAVAAHAHFFFTERWIELAIPSTKVTMETVKKRESK